MRRDRHPTSCFARHHPARGCGAAPPAPAARIRPSASTATGARPGWACPCPGDRSPASAWPGASRPARARLQCARSGRSRAGVPAVTSFGFAPGPRALVFGGLPIPFARRQSRRTEGAGHHVWIAKCRQTSPSGTGGRHPPALALPHQRRPPCGGSASFAGRRREPTELGIRRPSGRRSRSAGRRARLPPGSPPAYR